MATMKTLILDAAIATIKMIEAGGTVENLLDTVDAISDIHIQSVEHALANFNSRESRGQNLVHRSGFPLASTDTNF